MIRTPEYMAEKSRINHEIDKFIQAGGDLLSCVEMYRGGNFVILASGLRGNGLGIDESEYEVVHKIQMQILEAAIEVLCQRLHKARSKSGMKRKP